MIRHTPLADVDGLRVDFVDSLGMGSREEGGSSQGHGSEQHLGGSVRVVREIENQAYAGVSKVIKRLLLRTVSLESHLQSLNRIEVMLLLGVPNVPIRVLKRESTRRKGTKAQK